MNQVESSATRPSRIKRLVWWGVILLTVLGWCGAGIAFVKHQRVQGEGEAKLQKRRKDIVDFELRIRQIRADSIKQLDEELKKKEMVEAEIVPLPHIPQEQAVTHHDLWPLEVKYRPIDKAKARVDEAYAQLRAQHDLPYESIEALWLEHERLLQAGLGQRPSELDDVSADGVRP